MNSCFFALCSGWDSHIIPISRYGNDMGVISECYWNNFGIFLGMIFIPFANSKLWFEIASSFCKEIMCRHVFKKCFVFTHNFSDILNSCRLVVSEKRMWGLVTLKAGENCKLKPPAVYIVYFPRGLRHLLHHCVALRALRYLNPLNLLNLLNLLNPLNLLNFLNLLNPLNSLNLLNSLNHLNLLNPLNHLNFLNPLILLNPFSLFSL